MKKNFLFLTTLILVGLASCGKNEKSEVTEDIPTEITELANQRLQAKQEKNYTLADELRVKIQEK